VLTSQLIPSLVGNFSYLLVTGFNVHLINTVVCSICVFYTMFGGIKAVVWTDVIQAAIMVASVVLVGVLGAHRVGGFFEVLRIAGEGGRLDINYNFDLTTRSTIWNIFTSATMMWTGYVGLNQSCVQRIVSLPSLGHARRSLVLFGFGFILIMFFNCFTGIVIYSRFHDCDPIQSGHVSKVDKMVPYFVQDTVGNLWGMPGVSTLGFKTIYGYINDFLTFIKNTFVPDFQAIKNIFRRVRRIEEKEIIAKLC